MTTVLQATDVPAEVEELLAIRRSEAARLDRIYKYVRAPEQSPSSSAYRGTGDPNGPLHWLRRNTPPEIRRLADISRVPLMKFVIASTTQVMYVDGFQAPRSEDQEDPWTTWQLNHMDARQIGVHRAANTYGVTYLVVRPPGGREESAVMRGVSPRKMTAAYGIDSEWPELALEEYRGPNDGYRHFLLYDARSIFMVKVPKDKTDATKSELEGEQKVHGLGVCPVVRFLSEIDDDGCIEGDVEPLMTLQDQVNVTTFGLLVTQHFGAFPQRWITGFMPGPAKDEHDDGSEEDLEAAQREAIAATQAETQFFDDPDVKVGQYQQADLTGYLNSRDSAERLLATVSQTPAHDLLGQLVNLSAEALAAAEASKMRKVTERQTSYGESWEQALALAGRIDGQTVDPMAEVRWRNTETRSFASVVDALGKMATMLNIPVEQLWELVPDVTQQQIDRWREAAADAPAPDPNSVPVA